MVTGLALVAGIGILAWLIVRFADEARTAAAAVASVGWGGILALSAYRTANLVLDAVGWQVLFEPLSRPPLGPLFLYRWICESINNLLPVAQVGGDLERARLAARRFTGGAEAGAATLVDFTAGVVAQVIYGFLGAGLLAASGIAPVSGGLVVGLLAGAVLVGAFLLVQQRGLFLRLAGLARCFLRGPGWKSMAGTSDGLDQAIARVYRRRRDLLISWGWRLASWILHAGETWIALKLLGSSAGLLEALILDSLTTAARSAAFLIPGALGVQEGAYLVLGAQLGLSPELSLSLALFRRLREVLSGAPGLPVWMVIAGRDLRRWGMTVSRTTGPAGPGASD